MVQSVQQDALGRVWVFINLPVTVWREGDPYSPETMDRYYRTRIEVIDPVAGRVVTRHDLEGWALSALPGQQVALLETSADAEFQVRIVQLTLAR
jgi:hypothetical protein